MSRNQEASGKIDTPKSNPKSCRTVQFQTPRSAQTGITCSQKLQCSGSKETTPGRSGPSSQGTSARRLAGAFKSPLRISTKQSTSQSAVDHEETLESEILELKQRNGWLDQEIQDLLRLGYCEEELKDHIENLHEYNEMKDVGQMILGRLAVLQQMTTKELYQKYELELED